MPLVEDKLLELISAVLYSIMNTIKNDPANISVTNEVGQHIPFRLYVYSIQDFI